MSGDNILTELASGDYYEVVRQRLPWIESTIPEPRKVVEALRISPAYIETTVEVLERIWGEYWHPYTEPPDTDRIVMLRFDYDGTTPSYMLGRYNTTWQRFERRLTSGIPWGYWQNWFVSPGWWRELTEGERDEQ